MNALTWTLMAVCLPAPAADDHDAATKKDREKLQGAWKMQSLRRDGTDAPAEFVADRSMTFDGDKVLIDAGQAPDEMFRLGGFLKSLTPRQELAQLLAERGGRLQEYGRHRTAVEALAWSWATSPGNELIRNTLLRAMRKWEERLRALEPPGFPAMYFRWTCRRFTEGVALDVERHILFLEAYENLLVKDPELDAKWWGPMRRGVSVTPKPSAAMVQCHPSGCEIQFKFN